MHDREAVIDMRGFQRRAQRGGAVAARHGQHARHRRRHLDIIDGDAVIGLELDPDVVKKYTGGEKLF